MVPNCNIFLWKARDHKLRIASFESPLNFPDSPNVNLKWKNSLSSSVYLIKLTYLSVAGLITLSPANAVTPAVFRHRIVAGSVWARGTDTTSPGTCGPMRPFAPSPVSGLWQGTESNAFPAIAPLFVNIYEWNSIFIAIFCSKQNIYPFWNVLARAVGTFGNGNILGDALVQQSWPGHVDNTPQYVARFLKFNKALIQWH